MRVVCVVYTSVCTYACVVYFFSRFFTPFRAVLRSQRLSPVALAQNRLTRFKAPTVPLALAVAQHARTQPLAHSPRLAIMSDDIFAFISVSSLTARR